MAGLKRRIVLGGGLAAALGLVACSPAAPSASNSSAAGGESSAAPTETQPPSSAAPPVDPTALKPGTNHNNAADAYAYPAQQVQTWVAEARAQAEGKPETKSTAPEKLVFLTFDDGPNTTTSVQILDILKEHQVPATFFLVGKYVEKGPETIKRQIAEGHAVAMHSFTHDYKKLYPGRNAKAETVMEEFHQTKEAIRGVLGPEYDTTCWRYPGGHMSWKKLEDADAQLAAANTYWIDWDSLTGDAEPPERQPRSVSEMVTMATVPTFKKRQVTIMLAHDAEGMDMTVQALPEIIKEYQKAGYKFGVIA